MGSQDTKKYIIHTCFQVLRETVDWTGQGAGYEERDTQCYS